MPPDNNARMGSFGAAIPGGVDPVREALQRRGMGENVPLVGQVSQGAGTPGGPAGTPQPIPQAPNVPLPSTAVPLPPTGPQTSPQEGLPTGHPEAQIILRAMTQRLQSISKQEEGNVRPAPAVGPGGLL